jgi:hypothetical protein
VVSWTTPGDVRAAVRKKWDSGELLRRYGSGEEWVPLRFAVRGPQPGEIGELFTEVRSWAAEWARAPMRVEYKRVGGRHIGANEIPCRAWLDSPADAWALLGTGREVSELTALLAAARAEEVGGWVERYPLRALAVRDRWDRLLAVVRWIDERQRPGMYLRQVDVPGVDTKFIEANRGVLAGLLDLRLPASRIDLDASDFAARYGFRRKPALIRFRVSDGCFGFSELSVRAREFTSAPAGIRRVYVIENEITYLAFPVPSEAMVIWGQGYAVGVLEPLTWLAEFEVVYWGDIDTHGFAILDGLRAKFPHVSSILMDRATLEAHRAHWGTEEVPAAKALSRLTVSESSLCAELTGSHVRLEQERVRFSAIAGALNADIR